MNANIVDITMSGTRRKPIALNNTTLYFQGRPNVAFLDRFAGRSGRHTKIPQ